MRMMLPIATLVATASLGLAAQSALAANAVQKECSTKYQAAKASNQLAGQSWNQYYKQCAADAAKVEKTAAPATPAPAPAAPAPATTKAAAPATPAPAPKTAKKMTPAAVGGVIFPNAIAPAHAKESAGKARMHTCLDQYNANKTSNGNGGLKWIEKGGGYYSECNKKLKG